MQADCYVTACQSFAMHVCPLTHSESQAMRAMLCMLRVLCLLTSLGSRVVGLAGVGGQVHTCFSPGS